jgi:hypothetical protein
MNVSSLIDGKRAGAGVQGKLGHDGKDEGAKEAERGKARPDSDGR